MGVNLMCYPVPMAGKGFLFILPPAHVNRIKPHSARALHNGFDNNGRQLVRMRAQPLFHVFQILNIRLSPKTGARAVQKNLPGKIAGKDMVHAVYRVANRHRAQGVAMVCAKQGAKPRFSAVAGRKLVLDGHFERDFDGHGA